MDKRQNQKKRSDTGRCLRRFCVISVLMFCSCIAGRGTFYVPVDMSLYQINCGSHTIRFNSLFTDGFAVVYYFGVPLVPLFNHSDTDTNLEVDITVHSDKEAVFDIELSDVEVKLPESGVGASPKTRKTKVESRMPEKPWFYRTTRFTFDLDRSQISEYSLTFPNGLNGCGIPDIPFRKNVRSEWAEVVNR